MKLNGLSTALDVRHRGTREVNEGSKFRLGKVLSLAFGS